MQRLLNLEQLGGRLATLDSLILQLVKRRMNLAEQVGQFKRSSGEAIYRKEVEDRRIQVIRDLATRHGLNPHFAESLLYLLINESCKLQMIQLQDEALNETSITTDEEWYSMLKANLLKLTELWCETYDSDYENGYFATRSYLRYEERLLEQLIVGLEHTDKLADLGCATGRLMFKLHSHFEQATGFDISQHMVSVAHRRADAESLQDKCQFECVDLEDGIPLPDESVSLAVMNLGTASDVRNIKEVISETWRILKSGGKFFFSFYNRDALIYSEFLPWEASLVASVNIYRDSLDVHCMNGDKQEIVPVFARAYNSSEVQSLFEGWQNVQLVSFPVISAVLPNELFESKVGVQESVEKIDEDLVNSGLGAYLIATGCKP